MATRHALTKETQTACRTVTGIVAVAMQGDEALPKLQNGSLANLISAFGSRASSKCLCAWKSLAQAYCE